MKVRIDKCRVQSWWYRHCIGAEYEVIDLYGSDYKTIPESLYIEKSDCTIIEPNPTSSPCSNKNNMITIIDKRSSTGLIKMSDMKPCSFAVVEDESTQYNGHLVMRTNSAKNYQAINLSSFIEGQVWADGYPSLYVRPVEVQIKITILGEDGR